ncbi:fam-a protein [Plasmodium chabaudi chabaudi]|uniref:Fam-a protein n=1 Tax=Plasmodium chabaudi chabaudi TaxID=31271 RepID=A0A077TL66_PLACU|nr:fam-a protein [Plasmodium chabaudi chabaudi]SCL91672.1 fam-a protein [Plasmodium chabaudi chabaudi]VTZ68189.1 fam-a protein [Plasmodium chabaudi chabaudi]|eukprot:XP_016653694.1 fam-a protein [Plasmodium chabaudi chabaudi]
MNKGYIKIALALLSVAGYMQNIVFASETAVITNSSNENAKYRSNLRHVEDEPEEFSDPEKFNYDKYIRYHETKEGEQLMAEALNFSKKHAMHTDDYTLYSMKNGAALHFKKVNNTEIGKLEFTIPNANNYDDIVNTLWDVNAEKKFNNIFVKGSATKVYNENLAIVQQRYKAPIWDRYFYALANKVKLSEDETAIFLVSSDINDGNICTTKKYVNPIIKSANLFEPEINYDDDVISAKIHKFYVNLITLFIKKEADGVKITHLCSIDYDLNPKNRDQTLRKMTAGKMLSIVKLRDIFKNE